MADVDPTEYLVQTRGQNFAFAIDAGVNVSGKTIEAFEISPSSMATGWTATATGDVGTDSGVAGAMIVVTRPWGTGEPEGTGQKATVRFRTTDGTWATPATPVWFQ